MHKGRPGPNVLHSLNLGLRTSLKRLREGFPPFISHFKENTERVLVQQNKYAPAVIAPRPRPAGKRFEAPIAPAPF